MCCCASWFTLLLVMCDTTYFLSDPTQSQTPAGIYWIPVLMDTNTWCIQKLSVLSEVCPVCFPGIMWLLLLCLDPLAKIDHYMRTLHANAYLATATGCLHKLYRNKFYFIEIHSIKIEVQMWAAQWSALNISQQKTLALKSKCSLLVLPVAMFFLSR